MVQRKFNCQAGRADPTPKIWGFLLQNAKLHIVQATIRSERCQTSQQSLPDSWHCLRRSRCCLWHNGRRDHVLRNVDLLRAYLRVCLGAGTWLVSSGSLRRCGGVASSDLLGRCVAALGPGRGNRDCHRYLVALHPSCLCRDRRCDWFRNVAYHAALADRSRKVTLERLPSFSAPPARLPGSAGAKLMSAQSPTAAGEQTLRHRSFGPCVDGSELARRIFTCSVSRSSHVFGLLARYTRPLAIMPSADQVPVNSTHSKMPWPMWVVLIAGSTGVALSAVRPSNC
jgi:hypothetical protein